MSLLTDEAEIVKRSSLMGMETQKDSSIEPRRQEN